MSAVTLSSVRSRHNQASDAGQITNAIYHEGVTRSISQEDRSLFLEQAHSSPEEFWEERYNNNLEYCSGECEDNSENSNRKHPRELMHMSGRTALSPQTPNSQNAQDHLHYQQTLPLDKPGSMDGSHDDRLNMFMLHLDLDLSTLHESVDNEDCMKMSQVRLNSQGDPQYHNVNECEDLSDKNTPDSSVTEAAMSPSAYYNHGLLRASLNTDEPPVPPVQQDLYKKYSDHECNYHIKQVTMKIQELKNKINSFEESFEMDHGYKPSYAEKVAQPHIKKYMSKLAKARKDLKRMKEDAENGNRSAHNSGSSSVDARRPKGMNLDFILQSLGESVPAAGRLDNFRPSIPLELQTVPEDEMMEIPLSFSRDSTHAAEYLNQDDADNQNFIFSQQDMANFKTLDFSEGVHDWSDSAFRAMDAGGDSHFHEMSLPELYREVEFSRAQRGSLRRVIRDFEHDFFITNGRKVRKENRFPLQNEYKDYKKIKARLRLLEALILKHYE
ncbi:hypothetical protein BsWGS_20776 [Bradybaena similaris]